MVGRRPRAGEVLALLLLINVLNYYDRQLLGAVAESVRHEFGLGDGQLGMLSTAFTLVYAVMGLPLGYLSDRLPRTRILAGGVLLFSLFTALVGLVRSIGQLVAARLLVGVGEASCAPAATALCADLFPPGRRARAMAVFMLGLPLGVALSYGVSGPLARAYGWRSGFVLAGVPGVICALWALRLGDPGSSSGGGDRAWGVRADRAFLRSLGRILRVPTMGWLMAAGILHTFIMQVLAVFLSPYLMRCHGLDVRAAGLLSMVVFGLSGIPGLLLGGGLGDAVTRGRPAGRLYVGAGSTLLLAPLLFFSLQVPRGEVLTLALLLFPACGLLYVYYSTVYATLHDVVPDDLRGTGMAAYLFAMYVLGASLGPMGTGMLSDHYARQAALHAGVVSGAATALEPFRAAGLAGALRVVPLLAGLLSVILLLGARSAGRRR